MASYADVIVDLSLDHLDQTYTYRIPEPMQERITPGTAVLVPFGSRTIGGYVLEVKEQTDIKEERLRPIEDIRTGEVSIESQLIALAGWMHERYGATMNQALHTVIPVHKKTPPLQRRRIRLLLPKEEAQQTLLLWEKKHAQARAKLLRELIRYQTLDYDVVTQKLKVSSSVIRALMEQGVIAVETNDTYRDPIGHLREASPHISHELNEAQKAAVTSVTADMDAGLIKTYLLRGVTGSGKTEVYMELIAHVLSKGRQVIVLIPEIALTYQTVMRFCGRFGENLSILNSRMSDAQRYDQYKRAKDGEVSIIIGPRSALFAPFPRLGLIIIDEEHESSYKSETMPRYHAREAAVQRARLAHASVVLGSATPSLESYYRAQEGEYCLLQLPNRVLSRPLPVCETVDLRRELREGNRSIFSLRLQELIEEGLKKREQTMIFLNRRGRAGFLSCRSCGTVIRCPHCDVSLAVHNSGVLICHYCGYRMRQPMVCPTCGSPHIAGFLIGTQRVEEMLAERFPTAKILRMDYDTTRGKDAYESILQSFSDQKADILIGTQMIVKGHDFPNVTLMGILAADMSLYSPDYRAAERTFDLLTQAAGRAGRGDAPGHVIIQTYNPDHYAVKAAVTQDYPAFYEQEIAHRRLLSYPPLWHMLRILGMGGNQSTLDEAMRYLAEALKKDRHAAGGRAQIFGPNEDVIGKIKDTYRMVIYLRSPDLDFLVRLRQDVDAAVREGGSRFKNVSVQYDFDVE